MEHKEKKIKKRSPNYPAISLPEAIEKTNILYKADGRSGSMKTTAYRHLGYKGEHGASLKMLSAIKKYGLLIEVNNRILLTEEAEFILIGSDEKKKLEIIKKCALAPEIYQKLWEQYSDTGLPGDESLKDVLVFDKGFNPKSVGEFIKDFKATIEFAELNPNDTFEMVENQEEEDMIEAESPIEKNMTKGAFREYLIPQKENKTAILKLELPVNNEDIDLIIKWLDVLRLTIT